MYDKSPQPTNGRTSAGSTITTVLITLSLVGASWLFTNRDMLQIASATVDPPDTGEAQAWPTTPPTFTPIPTQPAQLVSSPTPIPTPTIRQLNELVVIEYTLHSTQTAGGPDGNKLKQLFGNDEATVRAVGLVRVSVSLATLERELSISPDGRAIAVRLPKLIVSSVELLPDQTSLTAQQRWLLSEYPGLELQAIGLAKNDMYNQVANNPEMMELATEVARYRVIEHLRGLGFTDITVTTS